MTREDLQERIKQLGSLAQVGGERQDAKESILDGLSKLKNEVSDATSFVPAYDQRIYSQVCLRPVSHTMILTLDRSSRI